MPERSGTELSGAKRAAQLGTDGSRERRVVVSLERLVCKMEHGDSWKLASPARAGR
jgi:hypothetical protein